MTHPSIPACLFCRTELASSDEHVVLNALGGKRVTKGISCESCNNHFGSTIDKELEEAYRFPSLLAGAYTGRNKPVAPLTMERSDTGEHVHIHHGGSVRPKYEATVTIADENGSEPDVRTFRTFDIENIAQMVAAEATRRGRANAPAASGISMIEAGHVPFNLNGSLGGPAQFRAVAKMGLAALVKKGLLKRGTKARKCGRWISSEEGNWPFCLDAAAYPAIRDVLGTDDGVHVLALWAIAGRLEATFLAFGFIPYRVRMPGPVDTTSGFAHVVNPVKRTHAVIDINSPPDLASIEQAFRSQEQDNQAIQALFGWVDHAALLARARGTVEEAFDTLRAQGFDTLETEQIPELCAEITNGLFPRGQQAEIDASPLTERVEQLIQERKRDR